MTGDAVVVPDDLHAKVEAERTLGRGWWREDDSLVRKTAAGFAASIRTTRWSHPAPNRIARSIEHLLSEDDVDGLRRALTAFELLWGQEADR